MHEASLMNDLMHKIGTVVQEQSGKRAVSVQVRLGALSHFSIEHFREHFERAAQGTVAENANLEIELSSDIQDPHAQEILLESVEVEL